jgi:MFS family permease
MLSPTANQESGGRGPAPSARVTPSTSKGQGVPSGVEGHSGPDESIGSILRGVLMDLRTLIREEVALARVEFRKQAGRARGAALSLGIAAVSLVFGATFLLIAIATGIADAFDWPVWAGFVIVAAVLSLIGFITLASGRRQLQQVHAVPEETVSTLKENSAWIAKRLSSVRR